MNRKIRKDDIFWLFLATVFFALGTLGFSMVPDCYRGVCNRAALLGCGSLIISSGGLVFIAGTVLYYVLDIEGWIREKLANHQRKKISKAHFKNILKKLEEEEE